MKRSNLLPVAGIALGSAALLAATVVRAQSDSELVVVRAAAAETADRDTPNNWSWEIRDGKRVPKGQRSINSDGSWRETVKVGSCTTVKERSAAGEYKESRSCN